MNSVSLILILISIEMSIVTAKFLQVTEVIKLIETKQWIMVTTVTRRTGEKENMIQTTRFSLVKTCLHYSSCIAQYNHYKPPSISSQPRNIK